MASKRRPGMHSFLVYVLLIIPSSCRTEAANKLSEKLQTIQKQRSPQKSDSGVSVQYEDWYDNVRNRTVPVKLYLPSDLSKAHPIVIFSHGLGGSREAASYLLESFAANGYVCVSLQHPGSDSSVWQNSGARNKEELLSVLSPAANFKNLSARVYDVKFAIDHLEETSKTEGRLAKALDLSKIACAGHSFGAGTALAIAGQTYGNQLLTQRLLSFKDPRVKAAIYLSPPVNLRARSPEQVYSSIDIPGLLMTGTEDSSPIGSTSPEERLLPFEGIKRSDQYLINFVGGDHAVFGGRSRTLSDGRNEQVLELIKTSSNAFLDAYLKDDSLRKAWLKKDCNKYLGTDADFKSK